MKIHGTNPFDVERRRTIFAKRGDFKSFRETYSKKNIPEIRNFNTVNFWNNLLFDSENNLEKSPIFIDKKRKIVSFLSNKKGKLLSIGFGTGSVEKEIARSNKNIKLFGLDISNKAVESLSCKKIGRFIKGDISKIPFGSSNFDFILILDVLEHIPPTKTFVAYRELKRVLKKNGLLILSVPLNENLESLVSKGKNVNSHLREYTPEIIRAELQTFDFILIKKIYLFAFSRFYLLKTFLIKMLSIFKIRNPNLIIVVAKK